MEIVSLTGTQNIAGGESQFSMVVQAGGEHYNIPIGFDTYQLLNELAAVAQEAVGHIPLEQEAPVFESPVVHEDPPAPAEERGNPLEQLAKVGLFEPQNVLDVVKPSTEVDELMAVLEDTSDEDEEDDPGEMSIDDSVEQYQGS